MMITTLGWALVALGVAVSLVPVLYGVHLTVVHERLREARAVGVVAVTVEDATSCPYCGGHVSVDDLANAALDLSVSSAAG